MHPISVETDDEVGSSFSSRTMVGLKVGDAVDELVVGLEVGDGVGELVGGDVGLFPSLVQSLHTLIVTRSPSATHLAPEIWPTAMTVSVIAQLEER